MTFKILFSLFFPLYLQAVIVVPEPSETWKFIQDLILGKDRMVIMSPTDNQTPFYNCVLTIRTTKQKGLINLELIHEKLQEEMPCVEIQVIPVEQDADSLTCEWSAFVFDCVQEDNRFVERRKEVMHGFLKVITTEKSTTYYEYRTTEIDQVPVLRNIVFDSFAKI